jgi:hypothetical protein
MQERENTHPSQLGDSTVGAIFRVAMIIRATSISDAIF